MNSALRKKKLEEIRKKGEKYMTGIRIRYQGETLPSDAFRIPLEYLIYNKLNARVGSLVKSFEKQYRELDAENAQDSEIIEKFLWVSKPDRNKITQEGLARDGQQRYGIVTDDGTIIDGNRRAMLLNKIWREREEWGKSKYTVDHCQYFIAVILPEGADPKEVMRLETTYQMGEDEKLDYNPIEKYLRCKDLKAANFSEQDIADMMGEKKTRVQEWLQIMTLMDDYLNALEYSGIYTRLDKREGQFVDLNKYLKTYDDVSSKVLWAYDPGLDVADLKSVCFDYIRALYEGKDFRYIAKPSRKESIFCQEELWKTFLKEHEEKIESIKEPSIEDLRAQNPGADLSKLLAARDEDWTKKAKGFLQGNLNKRVRALEDLAASSQPKELLQRASETLSLVNTNVREFYTDETILSLLKQINSMCWEFQKLINQKRKVAVVNNKD